MIAFIFFIKYMIIPPHFVLHAPRAFAYGVPKRLRHMYRPVCIEKGQKILHSRISRKYMIIPSHFVLHAPRTFAYGVPKELRHMWRPIRREKGEKIILFTNFQKIHNNSSPLCFACSKSICLWSAKETPPYIHKIIRLAARRLLILFRLPQPEAKVIVSKGDRSYMEGVLCSLQIYPARAF